MTRRDSLLLIAAAIVVLFLLYRKRSEDVTNPVTNLGAPTVAPGPPEAIVLSPMTPPTPVPAQNIGSTGSSGVAAYGNIGSAIPNVAYQLGDDYVLEDGSSVSINAYNDAVSGDDPAAGAGLLDNDPTDSGNETWEGS